jgi:hypothetical protein
MQDNETSNRIFFRDRRGHILYVVCISILCIVSLIIRKYCIKIIIFSCVKLASVPLIIELHSALLQTENREKILEDLRQLERDNQSISIGIT